jgi:hypothetical protein
MRAFQWGASRSCALCGERIIFYVLFLTRALDCDSHLRRRQHRLAGRPARAAQVTTNTGPYATCHAMATRCRSFCHLQGRRHSLMLLFLLLCRHRLRGRRCCCWLRCCCCCCCFVVANKQQICFMSFQWPSCVLRKRRASGAVAAVPQSLIIIFASFAALRAARIHQQAPSKIIIVMCQLANAEIASPGLYASGLREAETPTRWRRLARPLDSLARYTHKLNQRCASQSAGIFYCCLSPLLALALDTF